MHRLLLLGGGLLASPEGLVTGRATQGYRLALLALLAAEHPRPLTRDKLIAYLSSRSDAARGRRLLRQSLYLLRGALAEDVVLSGGDDLRLNPELLQCDLWEFRESLDRGDPEAAVAVYGGSFLDGFFLSRADEFERWVEVERARLALRYAEALEAVAEGCAAAGDARGAARAWRRLCEHDPYNSRVALRLMQALDAGGDHAGALRHAGVHAALLQAELGVDPGPDLESFAARLREAANHHGEDARYGIRAGVPEEEREAETMAAPAERPAPVSCVARATPGVRAPPRIAGRPRRSRRSGLILAGALSFGVFGALVAGERVRDRLSPLSHRAGASLPGPAPLAAGEARVNRSIAVLPFADLSPDGDSDYFSDGITEEIIAMLAKIGELRVTSRTSIMRYKATEKSLPEIARELGVAHILEGSVRRSGDRLRITAQLIDAYADAHLWAESYDRELSAETLFQIQRDIAQHIAAALQAEISPAERRRIERPATTDLAAYDFYLRGRDAMLSHLIQGHLWAVSLFDRALQQDPQFALAEAYRGDAYGMLWTRTRREEYRDSAYASHQRVLRMAPELPEGHRLLARYHLSLGRLDEAFGGIQRALELDPNHAGALHDLAGIHTSRGRLHLALPAARRAAALQPAGGLHSWLVFMTYVRLGDLENAERWYREVLEFETSPLREHSRARRETIYLATLSLMRDEREQVLEHLGALRSFGADEPSLISFIATTALHVGDLEGARRDYERQRAAFPDRWHTVLTGLAFIHARGGEPRRAEALLQEAAGKAQQRLDEGDETDTPYAILAQVHAIRGEQEQAIGSLETAYTRGWRSYYYARIDPRYDTLRGHPRFERLMATIRTDLDQMRARVREMEQP